MSGYSADPERLNPETVRVLYYYSFMRMLELLDQEEKNQSPAAFWMERIARCERIITDDLREKNFHVESWTELRYPEEYEETCGWRNGLGIWTAPGFSGDIRLKTDALAEEKLEQWIFLLLDGNNFQRIFDCGLSMVYQSQPTRKHACRVTFIATRAWLYKICASWLSRGSGELSDSLSVMKIDMNRERIDAEIVPTRGDGVPGVRLYPDGKINGEFPGGVPADWI